MTSRIRRIHSRVHEQGFRGPSRHDLRGDVAARARQQRHQSRPGISRRSRPGGYPPRGGRCGHGRLQSIPVDDGHSRIAAGDLGALPALAWSCARSDDRGDGDVGRHRGADIGDPGRGRARRRGGGFPAGVRFLSADHPPGRRYTASGAAGAAALAPDAKRRCGASSITRPRPCCSTIRSILPR